MKTAVCLKQVPASDAPLRLAPGASWIREQDTQFQTNEADLNALEVALCLREQVGGEVVIVSIGPDRVSHCLREGLAKGADRAIHVIDNSVFLRDPMEVASLLASVLAEDSFDLILTGLQSYDAGFGQTGVILAELIGYTHASIVTDIHIQENCFNITRELGNGWLEKLKLSGPAVLTIQAGINKPRYAGMKGIMAAKKKELKKIEIEKLERNIIKGSQQVENVFLPHRESTVEYLEGTPEETSRKLVERLKPFLQKT